MTSYNGWRNRETWLVNVWYNPETTADVDYLEETLQDELDSMPNGCLKDLCGLSEVDWNELRESVDEAAAEDLEDDESN